MEELVGAEEIIDEADVAQEAYEELGRAEADEIERRVGELMKRVESVLRDVECIQSADTQAQTLEGAAELLAHEQMSTDFIYPIIDEILGDPRTLPRYRSEMQLEYVRHLHRIGRTGVAVNILRELEARVRFSSDFLFIKDLTDTEVLLGREAEIPFEWHSADPVEVIALRRPFIMEAALRGEAAAAEAELETSYTLLTQGSITRREAVALAAIVCDMVEVGVKTAHLRLEDCVTRIRGIDRSTIDADIGKAIGTSLAKAYLMLGREEEALQWTESVSAENERWNMKLELARTYVRLKQPESAKTLLRNWENTIDKKRTPSLYSPRELEYLRIAEGYMELDDAKNVDRLLRYTFYEEDSRRDLYNNAAMIRSITLLRIYLITQEALRIRRGSV